MRKIISKRVLSPLALVAVLVFAASCSAADPTSNQTSGAERVATFDGGEVTQSDLQEAMDLFAQQTGAGEISPDSEQFQQAIPQVLPTVVQTEIAKVYAEENGVTVDSGDVDAEIKTIKEQLSQQAQSSGQDLSGDEAFSQALEQAGLTEKDLRADIRTQLPVQKVQEDVTGDVKPSQEEIQSYYDENKEAQFTTPPQRCASHILYGPDQKQQADETYQTLQDNPDRFEDIAREDSQDTGSAKQGGDLGCVGRDETVPNFEDALFGAEEGETVGPVKTQFGYHIIRVNEIRDESVQPLSEVEAQIRDQLTQEQQSQAFSEWLADQEEKRNVKYLPGYGPNAQGGEETTSK